MFDEIDAAFQRICKSPLGYHAIDTAIRKAVFRTFPYWVFHTFNETNVDAPAVLHAAQDPEYIRQRTGA